MKSNISGSSQELFVSASEILSVESFLPSLTKYLCKNQIPDLH